MMIQLIKSFNSLKSNNNFYGKKNGKILNDFWPRSKFFIINHIKRCMMTTKNILKTIILSKDFRPIIQLLVIIVKLSKILYKIL